jgi:hypothetical protein
MNLFRSCVRVNPKAQVLLTVSPVPLAATYENRRAYRRFMASRCCGLHAEAECSHSGVAYFPSYELITLPLLGRNYFDSDLRSVTPAGVKHVMRTFFRHMTDSTDQIQLPVSINRDTTLVCRKCAVSFAMKK